MAKSSIVLALLVVAVAAVHSAHGLFFHVTEGAQRCFIEEVPEDVMVLSTYNSPDVVPSTVPGTPTTGLKVLVTSPSGSVVLTRDLDSEGRFAFTSDVGGEHVICFSTNSTRWFGMPRKFRLDLEINVGEMAIDYNEVAKKEHLTGVEISIRKLNDKIRDIMKEQAYQRTREESFRDTSESTNARVQWWSIAQTVIVVVSGVWQIYHLRAFFRSKKLN